MDDKETISRIDEVLSRLPDKAEVELWANSKGTVGIAVHWSLKNYGFGELSIGFDPAKGKWFADTEDMSEASLTRILQMAVPQLVAKMREIDGSAKF